MKAILITTACLLNAILATASIGLHKTENLSVPDLASHTFPAYTHDAIATAAPGKANSSLELVMNEHVVPKGSGGKWKDLNINVKLDKTGKACLLATSERMVYYVPATGCRIRPAVMSLQLKTTKLNRAGQSWTWKISTPILTGTLPTAVFTCCIDL